MIFLTSSLGLEIFISAANPVFPWGLASLYAAPAWIFQEPRGFPKINETVLFHTSFGGKKIIPSHHSVACIDSIAAALLLQLVLTGSPWQLDLESGCCSIKTFNKIILKEEKKKKWNTSCSQLTIDLYSQAAPAGPGSPVFMVMHTSTSESQLLCSHMYACSSSHCCKAPALAAGPPSFSPTLRSLTWSPRVSLDLHDEVRSRVLFIFSASRYQWGPF